MLDEQATVKAIASESLQALDATDELFDGMEEEIGNTKIFEEGYALLHNDEEKAESVKELGVQLAKIDDSITKLKDIITSVTGKLAKAL